MLEKEKSIDAVLIATPDHQHAYISVACMQSGKHVYCEKPLTHNLWEARRVAEVAKSTGVATQMGNIGHSTDTIRETCEWLQAGAIGTVREVHAWVGTKRWNPTLIGKPTDTPPVPAGLNWDLWLGPRDPRPYNPAYFPVAWRDFWAFGGSSIGDFGCHDLDSACWALDLQSPETVEFSAAGPTDAEIAPHGSIGYYHFAPRGERGPIKITWYDGGLVPERPQGLPEKDKLPSRGVLFVGDKGEMLCGGAGGPARLLPQETMDAFKKPAPTIERSHGHHRDWLEACKGGQAASSNFAYGARLTELTLLGVLSLRTGKKIAWDPANLKAKGLPEADAIIREKYRAGWEVG
jgi:predicted dehydrogenase